MQNFKTKLLKIIPKIVGAFFAIIPVALALTVAFTIRVGVVNDEKIQEYAEPNSFYYCLRDTSAPEPGDLVLYYGSGLSKNVILVEDVHVNKEDGTYTIFFVNENNVRLEVDMDQIFGTVHIIETPF